MTTIAKQDFGPLLQVPSKDIHNANFDCLNCGNRVRKFLRFFPPVRDFMAIYHCGCTSVAAWEMEAPPSCSEDWKRLTQLQKRYGRDIVMLTPRASAQFHDGSNN
jgi:hypothetical protein